MKHSPRIHLMLFLSWTLTSIAGSNARAAAPSHVRVQLLADVADITPGKPFQLGFVFSIDPGWHIYWKNPGDAGMATKVKFNLPPGFTFGELQFPTPSRFNQPGNIVAFGYEKAVMLLVQVTPPDHLSDDFAAAFSADVSWLVCSDVCIQGSETVKTFLGVAAKPSPDNTAAFAVWIARLPVDSSRCPDVLDVASDIQTDVSSLRIDIRLSWKDTSATGIEFLPTALDEYNLRDLQIQTQGGITHIQFSLIPLTGKSPSSVKWDIVIGYKNKQSDPRGVQMTVPLPAFHKSDARG